MQANKQRPTITIKAIGRARNSIFQPIWLAGSFIVLAVPIAISYFGARSFGLDKTEMILLQCSTGVVSMALANILAATYQREYLHSLRGEPPKLAGMFNTLGTEWSLATLGIFYYLPYLAAWLVVKDRIAGGIDPNTVLLSLAPPAASLLFFPFTFAPLWIVDRGVGVVSALAESWKFTMRAPVEIACVLMLAYIASAFGLLACGIGLIITYPIYPLTQCILYEDNRVADLSEQAIVTT